MTRKPLFATRFAAYSLMLPGTCQFDSDMWIESVSTECDRVLRFIGVFTGGMSNLRACVMLILHVGYDELTMMSPEFPAWKVSLVFCGTFLLLGCSGMVPSEAPSYRYKETVVVETPEGVRTGSTVIEVKMEYINFGDHTNLLPSAYKGDAAAVDLPGGKVLFALLDSPEHLDWAKTAFEYLIPQQPYNGNNTLKDRPEFRQYQLAMALRGPQILPRFRKTFGGTGTESAYPYLVTFLNNSEPATIQAVNPDNLTAIFGQGYKLKAIVLEKTDDPVSGGIEKRLGWIRLYRDQNMRLDGSNSAAISSNNLSDNLGPGSFSSFGKFQ